MLILTSEQFTTRLQRQNVALKKLIDVDLPRIIGVEAVNHFSNNFLIEGFDKAHTWQEVKRRQSWTREYKYWAKKKSKKIEHRILTGGGHLGRSIQYRTEPGKSIIHSDLVYAPVHNEGLHSGRGNGFMMPERQFIGDSKELETKLIRIIQNKVNNILK